MRKVNTEDRDVILNFRFDFYEAIKIERFMRRHGYTSRSQLLRDALLKDRFTTTILAPVSELEYLTDLFDAIELMRKQVTRAIANTLQIVDRFKYYATLDILTCGPFEYAYLDYRGQHKDILDRAILLVEELMGIYAAAGKIFLDKRIMKNEEDMTEIKINPKALRHEYLAAGTTVSRKIEIIRALYRAGYTSLIPTDDIDLINKLFEAKQRHIQKHEDFVDKLMER